MRTFAAAVLQRGPQRSQPANAARPYRRGELVAGLCTVALIAELLLIPAAVPVCLMLLAVGRVSRWRLEWLFLPVLTGAVWLAVAQPAQLMSAVTHEAADPGWLRAPAGAAATALAWLPRELPVALVAGAVQAGLVTWLSQRRGHWSWRPGLMAAAQRWRGRALLAAGQTVTRTGCAIGLDTRTGRLAGFSWAEAERGVLLTGSDPGELSTVALAVVCAAMRRRKSVLVFDVEAGRDAAPLREPVALLAGALGMPVSRVSRPDGALRAAIGWAIRARGVQLASGPGALLAGEVPALLAWLGDRGLRGDSLLCVSGCEAADAGTVARLLALGPSTGTAVLASTTSAVCAAAVAPRAGRTVACGPVSQELAARLMSEHAAADGGRHLVDALTRQRSGELTIVGPGSVRSGCRAVPIVALDGLAIVGPRGAPRAAIDVQATDVPVAAGSR